MTVKRPTYIPSRFDWFPGEPIANRKVTIREAVTPDVHQIRALLASAHAEGKSPPKSAVYTWLGSSDYSVVLAVRNARNAVAICVSHVTPDRVLIKHLFVHPEYACFPIDERLILMAALELPERPTQIQVRAYDDDRCKRLRDLGWRCVKSEDDEGDRTFEYRFLRREDRDGRGADAPPEGPTES